MWPSGRDKISGHHSCGHPEIWAKRNVMILALSTFSSFLWEKKRQVNLLDKATPGSSQHRSGPVGDADLEVHWLKMHSIVHLNPVANSE